MSQVGELAGERSDFRILICGPRAMDYVLPFAVAGMEVTAKFASETDMSAATKLLEEVGLAANLAVGLPWEGDESYDAIILLDGWISHDDLAESLPRLKENLKPDGLVLMNVSKVATDGHVMTYESVVKSLRASGWLALRSADQSAMLAKAYATKMRPSLKRGRNKYFHFLDWFDGRISKFWPRVWSASWLFVCTPRNPGPLVVQIVPTLSAAGAERVAMSLAQNLPGQGFGVFTVANVSGGALEGEFEKRGLKHLVIGRSGALGRLKSLIHLRRFLKDAQPEIVQTHLFGADFWGRLAAWMAGIKNIVTTEHNVRTDFGAVGRLTMRMMSGFSRKYVAISREVADYLKTNGTPSNKIVLIPNGVEIGSIVKRPARPVRDVPKLLFVGRLEPQKDPATLLHALSKIHAPWELTVVGEGSLEPSLRSLTESLGISSRIRWFGLRHDVARIYAEHDFFLLPSTYEGFGLVAVEAAVAGIPIVCSDLPVLRGLLSDEGAAFVKPADPEAWSKAIQEALENSGQLINKATELSNRDWSRYSVEKMTTGYAGLYRELMEGKKI